ncbi:hypothetical protein [Paenibacillus sp. V4I7]|uniref:hypothetical protein n=1 Tax=Paenibacillus sp. V4I7 TaxID=3042307 RepID=UPI002782467E|nr:hypothetical protein [Paenibacillus sp. V4I7]MDQ0897425.1 hypothetical protein [Paenibacillus sp. V4I7]
MKKVFVVFLLLSVFLSTQTVSAKMSIIPPQDMLNSSDYIVVGNVIKQNTADKYRAVHKEITLSVEAVLKGEITQKEIVLKRDIRFHPGEVPYDFPKRGTKVMLLLRNNTNGLSLTYHNSICVIQDHRLSLYKGIGFGDWSVNEYEETYQAFYDSAGSIKKLN